MAKSVFISSTSKDLIEHRKAVNQAISKLEMRPIDQVNFGSQPGGAVGVSLSQVLKADYFVGIIAKRYGFVPEKATKSVTEQEYDEAIKAGIPRLMYLFDTSFAYDWPPDSVEDELSALEKLTAFRSRIEDHGKDVRTLFTTPEQLAQLVTVDLARLVIEEKKRRRLWIGVSILTILVIGLIIIATTTDWLQSLGILPITPFPESKFNVVVAGAGVLQSSGLLVQSSAADSVSDTVYATLKDFPFIDNSRGRNGLGVGYILGSTPEERVQQAKIIAKRLNADVVIYGTVEDHGLIYKYEPEFYIAPDYAALQPEFSELNIFGNPISILKNGPPSTTLQVRLQTMQLFLNGWANFILADYPTARKNFEDAAKLNPTSGLEVLYILAGNAASREPDNYGALELYSETLKTRPKYSRGLLGRGAALFQIAGDSQKKEHFVYDPDKHLPAGTVCNSTVDPSFPIEYLLELSDICFEEANQSPDKPKDSDVDVKYELQSGQLYWWRTQYGFGDYWAQAKQHFQQVIHLFDQSTSERQNRLLPQTALAYGYLADGLLAQEAKNDPNVAIEASKNYQQAINLFTKDANIEYGQRYIPYYQTQIASVTLTPAK